jgi:HNH endonuclease/AP2 domain
MSIPIGLTKERPLTAERARAVLSYDPLTGIVRSRVRAGKRKPGDIVGSVRPDGYLRIGIDYVEYRLSRVIWLMGTGGWPAGEVDHFNGDTRDHRWLNLRDVTSLQNKHNIEKRPGANPYLGITQRRGRWMASIRHGGKRLYLGDFDAPEKARDAYLAAKKRLHHPGRITNPELIPCDQ